ncbi:hypothetical protein ACWGKH_19010, partial [Streptomyces sp. NPDC054756]
ALQQLLADRLRVLGSDHPDTFTTRHDLAVMRGMAGDPAGAVDALEGLIKDELLILGPDYPDIQATQSSLDQWRTVERSRQVPPFFDQ